MRYARCRYIANKGIQTQQKAAAAQMNNDHRMREMELKYQKMILKSLIFKVRLRVY